MFILGESVAHADQIYTVTIDTSSLASGYTGPFGLDFELIGTLGNTVTLSNFSFGNGGSAGPLGSGFVTNTASGDLNTTITLDDTTNFFNDFNQLFTPGDTLSFMVDTTTFAPPDASTPPDNFSAVILAGYDPVYGYDPFTLTGGTPVSTTDPSGNDGIVDLDFPASNSQDGIYQIASVPEPPSAVTLSLGMLSLAVAISYGRFTRERAGRVSRLSTDNLIV
jgi:hypothetical protein